MSIFPSFHNILVKKIRKSILLTGIFPPFSPKKNVVGEKNKVMHKCYDACFHHHEMSLQSQSLKGCSSQREEKRGVKKLRSKSCLFYQFMFGRKKFFLFLLDFLNSFHFFVKIFSSSSAYLCWFR